jgi:hypothetical protein
MSELAIRENGRALAMPTMPQLPEMVAPRPVPSGVVSLVDWAEKLVAANTIAKQLCKTAFVPKHFFNKPEETAAAILTGAEMGLSPMAAVRAIFVLSGTPGMYAKAMVGVLQSRGHDVWVEEQSDDKVVVCGQRKGSTHVHRTTWDRARVVKAKLQSNPKYQDSPQQMMTARGQAEICRQVASDALFGVPYAVEEIEDFDRGMVRAEMVPTQPVTAAEILGISTEPQPQDRPAVADISQRIANLVDTFAGLEVTQEDLERRVGRPTKEWTDDDLVRLIDVGRALQRGEITRDEAFSQDQADAFTDTSGPMEQRQQKRMFALFAKHGFDNRDDQLTYIAKKLGYPVVSRGKLSAGEAAIVIDGLDNHDEPPAGDLG